MDPLDPLDAQQVVVEYNACSSGTLPRTALLAPTHFLVSDRETFGGLTQVPSTPALVRAKPLNANVIEERLRNRRRVR